MSAELQTELITLVILVLVVGRFLVRELRARVVRLSTMWVRPAFLIAMTALVAWAATYAPHPAGASVVLWLAGGAVGGIVVGVLVAGSTRVEATAAPGQVRLHGSWTTVAIWIVALALRFAVRFFAGGSLMSNSPTATGGTVSLVAAAFTVFAILIARRAKTLQPVA